MIQLIYWLHIVGMAAILLLSADLVFNGAFAKKSVRKFARFLTTITHIQVLTGLTLFVLKISEINHMKFGIKMLMGIVVAVLATMYSIEVKGEKQVPKNLLVGVFGLSIAITFMAFYWN